MTLRMVSKGSDGWVLHLSEALSAIPLEQEPDMLTEYLHEIRFPFRKRKSRFVFPPVLDKGSLVEILQHFYDGIADVVVEESKVTP